MKKNKIFFAIGSTLPIVIIPTTLLSVFPKKEIDIMDEINNPKQINLKNVKIDYLKNNSEIFDWISNTSYRRELSIENDAKKLFKLNNLNIDEKRFMLHNLKKKLNNLNHNLNQETKFQKKIIQDDLIYNSEYSEGQKMVLFMNENGEILTKRGIDDAYTIDRFWGKDETFIKWSNEHILYLNIVKLKKDLSEWWDNVNKSYYSQTGKKIEFNESQIIKQIEKIKKNNDFKNSYKAQNYSAASWVPDLIFSIAGGVTGGFGASVLKRQLADESKKKLQKIFTSFLVNVSSGRAGILAGQSVYNKTKKTDLEKMVIENSGKLIGFAVSLCPFPGAPAIGNAISTIWSFVITTLKGVMTGNGYTVWENINDHGLNDFSFQMRENLENMLEMAKHYSRNYSHGIEWKVTDGWFSFPELYVKKCQKEEEWIHLSNVQETGDSFNWGRKIAVIKK